MAQAVENYECVEATSASELCEKVRVLLDDDFTPVGGVRVIFRSDGGHVLVQALMKYATGP